MSAVSCNRQLKPAILPFLKHKGLCFLKVMVVASSLQVSSWKALLLLAGHRAVFLSFAFSSMETRKKKTQREYTNICFF